MLELQRLEKDCNSEVANATEHRDQSIRGAFISGLEDSFIWQRLLENNKLVLEEAVKLSDILKHAQENASNYE